MTDIYKRACQKCQIITGRKCIHVFIVEEMANCLSQTTGKKIVHLKLQKFWISHQNVLTSKINQNFSNILKVNVMN